MSVLADAGGLVPEPPVIVMAELVTPTVLRGADVRVAWDIKDADEVSLMVGDNRSDVVWAVKAEDYPRGCSFPVTRSGPVTIQVRNRYGMCQRVIGTVTSYEVQPAFSATLPLSCDASARSRGSRKQRSAGALRVLTCAAGLLPAGGRVRYGEEFGSELAEIALAEGGRFKQLAYAVRVLVSSLQLRAELASPRRRGALP